MELKIEIFQDYYDLSKQVDFKTWNAIWERADDFEQYLKKKNVFRG